MTIDRVAQSVTYRELVDKLDRAVSGYFRSTFVDNTKFFEDKINMSC